MFLSYIFLHGSNTFISTEIQYQYVYHIRDQYTGFAGYWLNKSFPACRLSPGGIAFPLCIRNLLTNFAERLASVRYRVNQWCIEDGVGGCEGVLPTPDSSQWGAMQYPLRK